MAKTNPTPPNTTVNTVMMICPNLKCRKVLRVPGQFRGQHVRCHYCQTTFEVPAVKRPDSPGASSINDNKLKK